MNWSHLPFYNNVIWELKLQRCLLKSRACWFDTGACADLTPNVVSVQFEPTFAQTLTIFDIFDQCIRIQRSWPICCVYILCTFLFLGPPGMPGLVYRVKGSETPHSVTLKWTRAPDHDSSVLFYHIEAQTVFNSTWRLLSRMYTCTVYLHPQTKLEEVK